MKNMNETEEPRCALCVRNGKCAKIFDLTYEDKTAEEIFLYCTTLKIRSNEFAICDGCMSDLIMCYEFVKKCRKLPSNYVEIYLDIENKLGFGECPIKQEMTQDEMVEDSLQECDESYNSKIKVEIGEEMDVKFNEDTSCNNDLSYVEDGDVPNQENHCYREDDYEIDEKIKLEKTEIIKFDPGEESRCTINDSKINEMERSGCQIESLDENIENVITSNGDKHNICKTYGQSFNKQKNINSEQKSEKCASDKRLFECHNCGKTFSRKHLLRDHLRMHMGFEPYKCTTCGKSFVYKRARNEHITHVHTDVGKKTCPICEKTICSKYIQDHIRTVHSTKGPCVCKICKKELAGEKALKLHMRIHTGNMPYMCETCGKFFNCKDGLKRHIDFIHLENEVCECPQCGKSYQCKKNLKKHIRTAHSDDKPHVCDICGKAFALKYVLKQHMLCHTTREEWKAKKLAEKEEKKIVS